MTIQDKFKAIDRYLNKVSLEREDLHECILLGVLTKHHVLVQGPPGTGKSYVERIAVKFLGMDPDDVFVNQLHLLSQMEENFGPMDMKVFESTGEWKRRIQGYLPTAQVGILEELDKAGPAVYGTFLTAINERKYKHGDTEIDLDLEALLANINADLDDPTGAMWDRFLLRTVVQYIKNPANFLALIMDDISNVAEPLALTPEERAQAQAEVLLVELTHTVAKKVLTIKEQLRAEGIVPSDRRFKASMQLLKASAWLDGRSQVIEDDLSVLRHTLWSEPEQIDKVTSIIGEHANPKAKEVLEVGQMVEALAAGLAEKNFTDRASSSRFAIEAKTQLTSYFDQLMAMDGQLAGRAEERRQNILDRIPEVTTQVMLLSGVVKSRQEAEAAVRVSMSR